MGLALVPDFLDQPPEEKYEECMNQLIEFCEEWNGAIDIKALRIVMTAAYLHLFTGEPPIWIWVNSPPRCFAQGLGGALGRALFAPAAGTIANELKDQTSRAKALWVLANMHGMFHRTQAEIEVSLRQLAAIEQGELEWHPRGIALDGRQGPKEAFIWEGRVTAIATCNKMDRIQVDRSRPAWPIVQNTFVNVRFAGDQLTPWSVLQKWSSYQPGDVRFNSYGNTEKIVATQLRTLILNLMDGEYRKIGFKSSVKASMFDPLIYLATIVACLRGPGFDSEALARKAVRLAVAHASLMAKPATDQEDFVLARKVLLDAIPPTAIAVLKGIPLESYWTVTQIHKLSGRRPDTIRRVLSLLENAGALHSKQSGHQYYALKPELARALMAGFD